MRHTAILLPVVLLCRMAVKSIIKNDQLCQTSPQQAEDVSTGSRTVSMERNPTIEMDITRANPK